MPGPLWARSTSWLALRLVASAAALWGAACSAREHPAQQTASRFAQALKYADDQALFSLHVESSPQGTYCVSPQWARLRDGALKRADPTTCAQARALTRALAQQPDEPTDEPTGEPTDDPQDDSSEDAQLALMSQLMRFVCEQPQGSCRDYAQAVFLSELRRAPLYPHRPKAITLQQLLERGDEAVVYLDLDYAPPLGLQPRLLRLRRTPQGWLVTSSLSELLQVSDLRSLSTDPS